MAALNYYDRPRVHDIRYYTWNEQQGMTSDELNAQWYDHEYSTRVQAHTSEIDAMIHGSNAEVLAS